MTLRKRLALSIVATAVPLVAALAFLRGELERRDNEHRLREFVLARLASGARERCLASPSTYAERSAPPPGPPRPGEDPGLRKHPGPPIVLFAYDASFRSSNPDAFVFPEAIRSALESGNEAASVPFRHGEVTGVQLGMKTGWPDGPIAHVLAHGGAPPSPDKGAFAATLLVLLFVPLLAALVVSGPIVRRIRALTASVRRSLADRYETKVPVSGTDEVAELATAFNEAGAAVRAHLETLERREGTLRAFVADTTHDVMIPLTVLQGHLDALRKSVDAGQAIDREVLVGALEEAHYLGSILHNLGAAAKLEAGEPHLKKHPVDLNELVQRVVARHRPIARPRGIEVDFASPEKTLVVTGDVTLLEQAVSNLVHNSVRYGVRGGHVVVLLEERTGDAFSLRVVDDGPGVPEADLPRIFERGFRGDAARTRQDGFGLGLDIARSVASRHDLAIEARRSQHGGLEIELSGKLASTNGAS